MGRATRHVDPEVCGQQGSWASALVPISWLGLWVGRLCLLQRGLGGGRPALTSLGFPLVLAPGTTTPQTPEGVQLPCLTEQPEGPLPEGDLVSDGVL